MRTGLWIILDARHPHPPRDPAHAGRRPRSRADAEAYQQWLAGAPTQRYGGWAGILDKLGLFHVFSTWYFMGLFVLLSAEHPRLLDQPGPPAVARGDQAAHLDAATSSSTTPRCAPPSTSPWTTRVRRRARAEGVARASTSASSTATAKLGPDVYADRFRWGPFGTVVAHLSIIIIMLGFVI